MNSDSKVFEFPEVRVVEASAGSGKTYALSKRYIQLILSFPKAPNAIAFRHILAITFTNKAAFEMKGRILKMLKEIALNKIKKEELEEILLPIGITAQEAQERAFMVMNQLIGHYNFFQVETIDKFINSLLSGCAFKIGLTANFKIQTNAPEYLQYSLDRLIDQTAINKDVRRSFEQFLHQYLYMENRTGWFPKKDIAATVRMLFEQHNTYGRPFLISPINAEDIVKKKRQILSDMKSLKDILPVGTNGNFVRNFEKFLSNNEKGFDVDNVSDYFRHEMPPVNKGAEVSNDVMTLWTKISYNLKQLCQQEATSLFNPYIDIYDQILHGFNELSSKDDVLFLSQLNQRASYLFENDGVTVEELYYRLATRFKHYLVDEFQDTSRLQWHNLEPMVEEALSTGGSLFYVGDRKQAIYGFRGGEVELFDNIKNRFNAFNVQIESLTKNWRSEKAIVEFNNTIFSISNLHHFLSKKHAQEEEKKDDKLVEFNDKDLRLLENVFKSAQQTVQPQYSQGYVQVERAQLTNKKERDVSINERVLGYLKELKTRFAYKDIAVLTRSNSQVEELTKMFLEAGIPVESERTSNMKDQLIILELIAFLKFLDSPIDNVSFAQVLTGELFANASGLSSEKAHDFIFNLRSRLREDKSCYLYVEFRQKYPEFWQKLIEPFFKNVGHYPLYELVVSIYHHWQSLKVAPQSQGFLMRFLELIKSKEEDYGDIGAFLEYFETLEGEELFVKLENADAVKILTIHKSKGLEFPVVILPYLTVDPQVCGRSDVYSPSYVIEEKEDAATLMRLKDKYYKFSEELYLIYRQHYIESLFSELNNAYVALTRAQKELYVILPQKVKNSFNLANLLIPEDCVSFGKKTTYTLKEKIEDKIIAKLATSEYHDWLSYLKAEFIDPNLLRYQEERLKGGILHYCLQQLTTFSAKKIDAEIKRAISEAQLAYLMINDWKPYVMTLTELLNKCEVQQFFTVSQAEVFNERELVDRQGLTKIPDRLMVVGKEVWIIDFKSSYDDQGRAYEQMKEYMKLAAELYPKYQVSGFLIYFDSLKVEKL